jgi:hypothetical protein
LRVITSTLGTGVSYLLVSTFLDYYTGIQIEAKSENSRKFWFWLSISMNLGFGDFLNITTFLQILFSTFEWFWTANESATIKCCSPVGISLYFSWPYVIDIYLKE